MDLLMQLQRGWILTGLLVAQASCCLLGGEPSPSGYQALHSTLDAGGGTAASTHYRLISSLGFPGGLSQSVTGHIRNRTGFVGSLNDPPRPQADTVRTGADGLAKLRVATLLANDLDPEADALVLRSFDPVSTAGGRVSQDADWLLYEPPSVFPGVDTFRYAVQDTAGNTASLLVTVLVAEPALQPSQNLIAITVLPNGHRYLAFVGIAGREYLIEWTSQLPASHWEVLATVTADRRGLIEWVDVTAPPPPERYYRTRNP